MRATERHFLPRDEEAAMSAALGLGFPKLVTLERLQALAEAVRRSADEAPLDLEQAGLTQRDALLHICDDASVWRSPDGEAFVSVPVGGHVEHHAIASRAFRHWLLH